MIVNGEALLLAAPIKNMVQTKEREHGVSYGLGEAGYDIRVKQEIIFDYPDVWVDGKKNKGNFTIASAIEEFQMPNDLVGIVHDKSTWARRGLSLFNTVVENGWKGFLTLELVYHGTQELRIPAGAGIAQVIFHKTLMKASYDGKYNNAGDFPQEAING